MARGFSVRCFLLGTILTFGLSRNLDAQCVVYKITVDGKVHSDSKDTQILVRVHANKGNKTAEIVTSPEGDRFHTEIGFDTFVSAHLFGAHNCSRHPTGVDVILIDGGVAKQTVKLSLERDFTWDERLTEWRTKVPVVIDGNSS